MYFSKVFNFYNDKEYYAEYSCDKCKGKPAVSLTADCHGDGMTLCKKHWIEWFEQELLPVIDSEPDPRYYTKVESEKYKEFGQIYKYDFKGN